MLNPCFLVSLILRHARPFLLLHDIRLFFLLPRQSLPNPPIVPPNHPTPQLADFSSAPCYFPPLIVSVIFLVREVLELELQLPVVSQTDTEHLSLWSE